MGHPPDRFIRQDIASTMAARPPPALGRSSVLRGQNRYCARTAVVQPVALGAWRGITALDLGDRAIAAYRDRFGRLRTLAPRPALRPGVTEALAAGRPVAVLDLYFEAVLAVEAAMAFAMHHLETVTFAECGAGATPDDALLIWDARVPEISQAAAETAFLGLGELLPEGLRPAGAATPSFDQAYADLRRRAQAHLLSPSSALIVQAAEKRGLPLQLLGEQRIRLGQGAAQRELFASITDRTARGACVLAGSKEQTSQALEQLGLPVPRQIHATSPEEAVAAAAAIGYPIVVKPERGKKGDGVTANLRAPAEIPPAFDRAGGGLVVVETFVEGEDHRLMVIDGRFVAGVRRSPPVVTGDGRRTIRALIAALNTDPFRDGLRRARVRHDGELDRLMARDGHSLDTILPPGSVFKLRATANVSTGGCAIDVTDTVHPDTVRMAIRAAGALGLDVAGIDYLTTDITRSYKETGGAIIEVNARPGLRPHSWPWQGAPRDVTGALLDALFPARQDGRIPIGLVCGGTGTGPVARALGGLLDRAGRRTAVATRRALHLDGSVTPLGDAAIQRQTVRRLMDDHALEALVQTASPRRVLDSGLDHQAVTVTALTAPGSGQADAAAVVALLARATTGRLVVAPAAWPWVAAAGDLPVDRLVLVDPPGSARVPDDALVAQAVGPALHLTQAGRPIDSLPLAGPDRPTVMATAMAWALGVPPPPDRANAAAPGAPASIARDV